MSSDGEWYYEGPKQDQERDCDRDEVKESLLEVIFKQIPEQQERTSHA